MAASNPKSSALESLADKLYAKLQSLPEDRRTEAENAFAKASEEANSKADATHASPRETA